MDPCQIDPSCGTKPLDSGLPWWFVVAMVGLWLLLVAGAVVLGRHWLAIRSERRRGRRAGTVHVPSTDVELLTDRPRPRRAHVELDEGDDPPGLSA